MPPSFDLVNDRFIPCVTLDGEAREFGLRQTLAQAHRIGELRDKSPLVTLALHRLLLAILHRCYQGPKSAADRVTIRNGEVFDDGRTAAYFSKCAGRFNLFDEKLPFYQVAGFSTNEPSGINRLAQELSRGNNAALFDHTTDNPPPTLTPAQAARLLIAEQCFAVGGGKSDTGNTTHAPLVSGAIVLLRGDNLFETLWLNLTIFSAREPVASLPDDAPVWERPSMPPHKQPSRPRGYLDYLTWQSRTLRLHPEQQNGEVVIRRVSYAQGRKFELPAGFFDPMTAYFRRDEKDEFQPVRFNEFRELWRDSAALFQVSKDHQEYERAPTCVHTLSAFELQQVLPKWARYRMSVFGLCTDKAKVNFWRHESLPLPLSYLDNPLLVESLKQALRLAERVAREALRAAVWAAAVTRLTAAPDQSPDSKRVGQLTDSLASDRLYWSRMELPFRDFLVDLARDLQQRDAQVAAWYSEVLRKSAINAFADSVGRLDGGRDLKAVNAGERVLYGRLKEIEKGVPALTRKGGAE
jgi:CRISPR system Cascade subunit CasA